MKRIPRIAAKNTVLKEEYERLDRAHRISPNCVAIYKVFLYPSKENIFRTCVLDSSRDAIRNFILE